MGPGAGPSPPWKWSSGLRPVDLPAIHFTHLQRLTGPHGLFEHAEYAEPRRDHGYSLDDNGRALVVICRAAAQGRELDDLPASRFLGFVEAAADEGRWSDRRLPDGTWVAGCTDDALGRAIWGLGSALSWWPDRAGRGRIEETLNRALPFDSTWPRALVYAVLGLVRAGEPYRSHLAAVASKLPRQPQPGAWRWPEPRLTYDNARLPEALIVAGEALGDGPMVDDGLALLSWLVEVENRGDHFSFTGVGGRGPGESGPQFDQQPLEAWAMADACRRAAFTSGEANWERPAARAVEWFLGANDRGVSLYEPATGAGCDGLTSQGVNQNQGAESTLAALGALLSVEMAPGTP
jgi:hypothetical protein